MFRELSFLLALFCVFGESRVTFQQSLVLDDVDLRGSHGYADFTCVAACRLFSPSTNEDIYVDRSGDQFSLAYISKQPEGFLLNGFTSYTLNNDGPENPSFILYIVDENLYQDRQYGWGIKVMYLNDADTEFTIEATPEVSKYTIISTTGSIRLSNFTNMDPSLVKKGRVLPNVYACDFDHNNNDCDPVYTARWPQILHTDFAVYSPLITVDFNSNYERTGSVVVSGSATLDRSTPENATAVYTSPGYVGNSDYRNLYSLVPNITDYESRFTVEDPDGLVLYARGESYWAVVKGEGRPLNITINGNKLELEDDGKTQTFYDSFFDVKVSWRASKQFYFALQLDVEQGTPPPSTTPRPTTTSTVATHAASTPTNSTTVVTVPPTWPNTAWTAPPTTSGVQPLRLFVSSIVISLSLAKTER